MGEMFLKKILDKEFETLAVDELKAIVTHDIIFPISKKDKNALEKIIEDGITSIPDYCFATNDTSGWASCRNAETLILPDTLESIGDNAFEDCKNIYEIHFEGDRHRRGVAVKAQRVYHEVLQPQAEQLHGLAERRGGGEGVRLELPV